MKTRCSGQKRRRYYRTSIIKNKSNDPIIETERIILTAAQLLKTEIKKTNSTSEFYPTSD